MRPILGIPFDQDQIKTPLEFDTFGGGGVDLQMEDVNLYGLILSNKRNTWKTGNKSPWFRYISLLSSNFISRYPRKITKGPIYR